jgi:hypothetical protein
MIAGMPQSDQRCRLKPRGAVFRLVRADRNILMVKSDDSASTAALSRHHSVHHYRLDSISNTTSHCSAQYGMIL